MREKIVTAVFCTTLAAVFLINFATPDQALSYSERRALIQRPSFDREFLFSGEAQEKTEAWMLDQFAFRDAFRGLSAAADLKLFRKKDSSGIYVIGDQVYKMDYPMNEQSVIGLARKMNEIAEMYLKDCTTAFAVIPDKSAYAAKDAGYLNYDHYELTGLLGSELIPEFFSHIDLFPALTADDYFRTDLHWKQEGLGQVLERIGGFFEVDFPAASVSNSVEAWKQAGYQVHSYAPFYGAYYGQAALNLRPDTLNYFSDPVIDSLTVENMDTQAGPEDQVIYNETKLGSIDSYEVFLSGNSPLITIENPRSATDRELIVFRDSFGSSIAPFLAEGYAKVTLIDLRFVGYERIGNFVEFSDQDVLFLYSTGVAGSSDMIRKY